MLSPAGEYSISCFPLEGREKITIREFPFDSDEAVRTLSLDEAYKEKAKLEILNTSTINDPVMPFFLGGRSVGEEELPFQDFLRKKLKEISFFPEDFQLKEKIVEYSTSYLSKVVDLMSADLLVNIRIKDILSDDTFVYFIVRISANLGVDRDRWTFSFLFVLEKRVGYRKDRERCCADHILKGPYSYSIVKLGEKINKFGCWVKKITIACAENNLLNLLHFEVIPDVKDRLEIAEKFKISLVDSEPAIGGNFCHSLSDTRLLIADPRRDTLKIFQFTLPELKKKLDPERHVKEVYPSRNEEGYISLLVSRGRGQYGLDETTIFFVDKCDLVWFFNSNKKILGVLSPDLVLQEIVTLEYLGIYYDLRSLGRSLFSSIGDLVLLSFSHTDRTLPRGEEEIFHYGFTAVR